MIMVADSLPGLKKWLAPLGLKDDTKLLVIRVIVAFLLHTGPDVVLARRRRGPVRNPASRSDQPLPGPTAVAESRYPT